MIWKTWRQQRILKRYPLSPEHWHRTLAELPLLAGLSPGEAQRLRDLVTVFLAEKTFHAKQDLELDEQRRLVIAAQACLPILQLGLDWYRDWGSLIVYPQGFIAEHEHIDAAGILHRYHQPLVGEAWERGPLVLSWDDVLGSGGGYNVVIHECAHKLDMLNGEANGFPPLHKGMDPRWWTRVFSASYDEFCRQVDQAVDTGLDPYAAESPGEFFAVMSEAFFELPGLVRARYGPLYRQLKLFYRQDPAQRLATAK